MSMRAGIVREVGTVCAVLAIYVLTLLAPIHHARASQVVFEKLGYESSEGSWVFCTPAGPTGQDRDLALAKCPATGIGKHDLVVPDLASLHLVLAAEVSSVTPPPARLVSLPRQEAPGSPRAPPAGI